MVAMAVAVPVAARVVVVTVVVEPVAVVAMGALVAAVSVAVETLSSCRQDPVCMLLNRRKVLLNLEK